MTPGARLLAALLVAAVVVGGLVGWFEWPSAGAPEPPTAARDDDGDDARAQDIRELREQLEAQRAALAEARSRRTDAADELEHLRGTLAETRARIERLEARTDDAPEADGDD